MKHSDSGAHAALRASCLAAAFTTRCALERRGGLLMPCCCWTGSRGRKERAFWRFANTLPVRGAPLRTRGIYVWLALCGMAAAAGAPTFWHIYRLLWAILFAYGDTVPADVSRSPPRASCQPYGIPASCL